MFVKFRIQFVLLSYLILSGCGAKQAVSEYIGGEDNTEPPSPLISFFETAFLSEIWSESIGKGSEDQSTKITPTILDEKIFVADPDGTIVALAKDTGKYIWRNKTKLPITGGTGVDDTLVLVGTSEGQIIGFSKETGEEKWRSKVSSEVLSSPRESDGVVVARTIDGKTFGLDALTGGRLWIYDRSVPTLSLRGTSTPEIANGLVIIGLDGGRVAVIELKSGKLIWEIKVAASRGKNEIERMVDIDAQPLLIEKTIYVSTYQSNVTAIALETGQILWQRDISSHSGISADDVNLYISDEDDTIWALDRFTGSTKWKHESLKYRQITGPANLGDKVIVGDFESYLHWLDKETGEITARIEMGNEPILSQPKSSGNMLFVHSSSGELAAYTYQNTEKKFREGEVSKKESDKRTAYERSRKKLQAKESGEEKSDEKSVESEDESSFFERFINIFSDDSEEEVE